MLSFDYNDFNNKLKNGQDTVLKVLGNNKKYSSPENISHEYLDKFYLAEVLTNISIQSNLNSLKEIGFTEEHLLQIKQWVDNKKTVTLQFKSEESCSFLRKKIRKVESDTKEVTSILSPRGIYNKFTSNVVTKITEYFWKFKINYSIVVYSGTENEKPIIIHNRKADVEIITTYNSSPRAKQLIPPPIELNITWLFLQLNEKLQPVFLIDRNNKNCYTPRRNDEILKSLPFAYNWYSWSISVRDYIRDIFSLQKQDKLDMDSIQTNGLFIPVLPLFKNKKNENENVLLNNEEITKLLSEEVRSFEEKFTSIGKTFTDTKNLITLPEIKILITIEHCLEMWCMYFNGIEFIEDMLKKQLISAIGKEVTPQDFALYMNYHYNKLFKKQYIPQKFWYAVQRIDHHPEGVVSILTPQGSTSGLPEPIITITKEINLPKPMKFTLDAATNVTLNGKCYIHTWVNHQFTTDTNNVDIKIHARSGPYSSYILMLGNIHASDLFYPTHAVIIQSKDIEIVIPLLLENLPTAKVFKEATESLSPEMIAFANAYRAMQLESTLFGLCIVQIKPQMEKLLNLRNDSLTKEIELTEDLQELFIRYQIPSDLLSYDGDKDAKNSIQIERVKYLVKEMQGMISDIKEDEVKESKIKANYDTPVIVPEVYSSSEEYSDEGLYLNAPMLSKTKKKSSFTELLNFFGGGSKKEMSYELCSESQPLQTRSRKKSKKSIPTISLNDKSVMKEKKGKKKSRGKPKPSISKDLKQEKPNDIEKSNKEQKVNENNYNIQEEFNNKDITTIPSELDSKFEQLDTDAALCSTIIKVSNEWKKTYRQSLLTDPKDINLGLDELKDEKNKAFDLLDALSRSGILEIDNTSFHVIMAATHSFEETLLDTLIKKSINPIEKMERSILIVGTTIHNLPTEELIKQENIDKIKKDSPQLFN